MQRKTKTFAVGDRVAYSVAWLKSTAIRTGDIPRLRGRIVAVSLDLPPQLCTIAWELDGKPYFMASQYHEDGLGRVISSNLTLVERIAIDAALN